MRREVKTQGKMSQWKCRAVRGNCTHLKVKSVMDFSEMDFPAVLLGNSGWEDLAKIPPNTYQVPSKCGTLPGDGGAS